VIEREETDKKTERKAAENAVAERGAVHAREELEIFF
tara:strand:+ start:214 stop:324 length:111 start_codon:yes stop_codon:yes gene_type:complete